MRPRAGTSSLTCDGRTRTMRAMQFETWDLLFNLAFVILWFRIFNPAPEGDFWNPYTVPLRKFTDSLLGPLRPAFPGLPASFVAAFLLVIVLAVRALACPRMPVEWKIQMGLLTGFAQTDTLAGCFTGSCVSAAVFLLQVWFLALLYLPARHNLSSDRTRNALFVLTRPFSALPHALRPIVLVLGGMGLALLVERLLPAHGLMTSKALVEANLLTATPLTATIRLLLLGLSLAATTLYMLQQVIIFLIIGAWGGSMFALPGLAFFCREWTDLLLGPLRRRPVRIGLLDLTPLVFLILLSAVQVGITVSLYQTLRNIP